MENELGDRCLLLLCACRNMFRSSGAIKLNKHTEEEEEVNDQGEMFAHKRHSLNGFRSARDAHCTLGGMFLFSLSVFLRKSGKPVDLLRRKHRIEGRLSTHKLENTVRSSVVR